MTQYAARLVKSSGYGASWIRTPPEAGTPQSSRDEGSKLLFDTAAGALYAAEVHLAEYGDVRKLDAIEVIEGGQVVDELAPEDVSDEPTPDPEPDPDPQPDPEPEPTPTGDWSLVSEQGRTDDAASMVAKIQQRATNAVGDLTVIGPDGQRYEVQVDVSLVAE